MSASIDLVQDTESYTRIGESALKIAPSSGECGLRLIIRHLPPGTSKWNRIEHRLFSFITGNWRGQPLLTHQVIIELIAATRTDTGLTVRCCLDQATYPKGITVADDELAAVNITRCKFHGEWNYTIAPGPTKILETLLSQSKA